MGKPELYFFAHADGATVAPTHLQICSHFELGISLSKSQIKDYNHDLTEEARLTALVQSKISDKIKVETRLVKSIDGMTTKKPQDDVLLKYKVMFRGERVAMTKEIAEKWHLVLKEEFKNISEIRMIDSKFVSNPVPFFALINEHSTQ